MSTNPSPVVQPMKVAFASAGASRPTTNPARHSRPMPAFAKAPPAPPRTRSFKTAQAPAPAAPPATAPQSPAVNSSDDSVRTDFERFVLQRLGPQTQGVQGLKDQPELLFTKDDSGEYQVKMLNTMWVVWQGSREQYGSIDRLSNQESASFAPETPRVSGFSKSSAPAPAQTQAPAQPRSMFSASQGSASDSPSGAGPLPPPRTIKLSRPTAVRSSGFSRAAPGENPEAAIIDTPPPFSFDPNRLSEQQRDIIYSDSPFVVGQAFAGTGKSTTGIGYAHMMMDTQPGTPLLSICFNRANAAELRGKYPSNTQVLTTHALATNILSERQRQRLRQANSWGPVLVRHELAKFGQMNANYRLAATIHSVLNSFFVDTSETIDPYTHGLQAMAQFNVDEDMLEKACYLASKFWLAMCTDNVVPGMTSQVNDIPIPHNAYLKRFVMGRPKLPFHTIIFDEAQDANPIMLKLLHDQYQQGAKVILLGDTHQSIYEFNGAVNAMSEENLPDDGKVRILPLTQSWRFGSRIAHNANLILSELKGEPLQVEGMAEDGAFNTGDPLTYITRTNAEVLRYAVAFTEANPESNLHWVGGIDGYRVHLLSDAFHLFSGRPDLIQDRQFKRFFPNWNEFERAAEVDSESRILKEIVEEYQGALPQIQATLDNCHTVDADSASLRLATGHKSKGLEFDHVVMANDFKDTLESAEGWLANKHDKAYPEQEVNLCYVLATRAKKSFTPSLSMQDWMRDLPQHRSQRVRRWGKGGDSPESWLDLDSDEDEIQDESNPHDLFNRVAPPPRF